VDSERRTVGNLIKFTEIPKIEHNCYLIAPDGEIKACWYPHLTAGDPTGYNAFDVCVPEWLNDIEIAFSAAMYNPGEAIPLEYEVRGLDGEIRYHKGLVAYLLADDMLFLRVARFARAARPRCQRRIVSGGGVMFENTTYINIK